MNGAVPVADWVWWAWLGAGLSLVAVGVMLLVWGLVWDRSRGRPRCPGCWYDMSGAAGGGLTCPECGRTAKSERQLYRRRRRWLWAAPAVLVVMVGTQVADWPRRAGEAGWTRFVPTSVLLCLWEPELEDFMDTGVRGSAIHAAVRSRCRDGWRAALTQWWTLEFDRQSAVYSVTTRARWPAGVVPEFLVEPTSKLVPVFGSRELEVRSERDPTVRYTVPSYAPVQGLCGTGRRMYELAQAQSQIGRRPAPHPGGLRLAPQPVGAYRERLTVMVKSEGWVIGRWTVEVPYEVVGTMDEAVPGVDSPEMSQRIEASLRASEYGGGMYEDVVVWAEPLVGGMPLVGEVLVDGEVVARLDANQQWFRVQSASNPHPWRDEMSLQAPSDNLGRFVRERVRLRLTGDQRRSFEEGAESYWSGTMEVSLGDVLARH